MTTQAEPVSNGPGVRRPRVLVIDDDAAVRLLSTLNLELAGFEVSGAEDGRRGLERAFCDEPDLVVLDVNMPGLDGFDVAEQLRSDQRTSGIPFVFVTGQSAPESRNRARQLGALGYLTKPFDPEILTTLVSSALAL